MKVVLSIPARYYKAIRLALLPARMKEEEAAFLFCRHDVSDASCRMVFIGWQHMSEDDYEVKTAGHIRLKDKVRGRIIKHAHDLNACVIECHSHLGQQPAQFSSSDLSGFGEFVPHVMWRLPTRPYAAIVMTETGYDALVWMDNPSNPFPLCQIEATRILWRRACHFPTGITYNADRSGYGKI